MLGGLDASETWHGPPLRGKLNHLLIVFYGHRPGVPMREFTTLRVVRWSPRPDELDLIRSDWERIQSVRQIGGVLSERLTRVLAASTKGPGRRAVRTRGYSLKPRFVHSVYLSAVAELPKASLQDAYGGADFERQVAALLHRYIGRTVASVRADLGIDESQSKSAQATVIRKVLGIPPRGRIREYEQFGLDVKTVPISPAGRLWENMSFPAFHHSELVGENWDESDLRGQLTRLLIVPLVRPARDFPRDAATLGRAFFWTPSSSVLDEIQDVWEGYRDRVAAGRPDLLPQNSRWATDLREHSQPEFHTTVRRALVWRTR